MKQGISYKRFMEIAREEKAWTILETWDEQGFNEYAGEFGPVTERQARNICGFTERVTEEELAAARYFSGE